ncbi:DNA-formamidopyrimidine glycosylase [Terrihalobacillus insolitus]|uniref:DNA-formamidopyrimidine glycosylase n=1 Tax=Terrihalobacillus insolitus TaxID=2950438 RepID=UPI002340F2C9|nr:DNA-formamidopyrimidine glycosylase [Terrihalobacillus insolitus]MDC3412614.1 DNA-formamidopyrimidine glycosylase [Terrihalobacillus insolitus]
MPELPEVETIRNTLKQLVLNKTIDQVEVHWGKIIKRPDDVSLFKEELIGETIHDIERKGKFLLFVLDRFALVSHLRMEGKYRVFPDDTPLPKHTHVIFHFTDGMELRYNDVRKFGTMHLMEKGKELTDKPLNQIGPDPFDPAFSLSYFYEKVHRSERKIKNILLDQSVVAGLGNIYVDETLFQARINPERKGNGLTHKEVNEIRTQAIATIQEAVRQGGTTIRSYVNSQGDMGMFQQQLFVYGQEDKPCKACGKPITKIKLGGRGTHICLSCQK